MSMAPPLSRRELGQVVRHAERRYPQEACGLILRRGPDESKVLQAHNAHAAPTVAYLVDPATLRLVARMVSAGWRRHAIYHSHPQHERAELSTDDVLGALAPDGGPTHPEALQVVVACSGGRARAVKAYTWDPGRSAYVVAGVGTWKDSALMQPRLLPLVETGWLEDVPAPDTDPSVEKLTALRDGA